MYALSRERVCHPDNDAGNLLTEPLSSNGQPLRFQQHATNEILYVVNVAHNVCGPY
jgi:hypothetical protein